MTSARILFAGDFRWASGSSHVVAEYVRVASEQDAEVRVSSTLGSHDEQITRFLPYESDLRWATHLVVVLEGNPFLDEMVMEAVDRAVPPHRRLVIDADGRSLPIVRVGSDDNRGPHGVHAWADQFNMAACTTICPRLGPHRAGRLDVPFTYFGIPPLSGAVTPACALRYVGANWWRFEALETVAHAFRQVDAHGRVEVCGRYWGGERRAEYEAATTTDRDVLADLGVIVRPPVPFGEVVSAMSEAVLSPVLFRPVLSTLGLLTPRVFEPLAASTMPLFMWSDHAVAQVVGRDGLLCLGDEPADDIARVLDDLPTYRAIADDLRAEMYAMYRYPAVFGRLLEVLA